MATQVMVSQNPIQLHIWDIKTGKLSITLPNLLYISPNEGSYEEDYYLNGGPPLKTILYGPQFEFINAAELKAWWTKVIKASVIYNHTPPENVADEMPIVIFYWPIQFVRQKRLGHLSALITNLAYISNWPGKDKLIRSTKGLKIEGLHKDIKKEEGLPLAFQFEPSGINIQLIAELWNHPVEDINWSLPFDNCAQTVAKYLQSGGLHAPQVINNSVGQYLKQMVFLSTLTPVGIFISIQSSVAEKVSRDVIIGAAMRVSWDVFYKEVSKKDILDTSFVKANRGIGNEQLVTNIILHYTSRCSDQIVRTIKKNIGQNIYQELNNKVDMKLRKKSRRQFKGRVGKNVRNTISTSFDQTVFQDPSSEINHMIIEAERQQKKIFVEEKNYSDKYLLNEVWVGIIRRSENVYKTVLINAIRESVRL